MAHKKHKISKVKAKLAKAKIIKALSPPKSEKAWAKWLKSGEKQA